MKQRHNLQIPSVRSTQIESHLSEQNTEIIVSRLSALPRNISFSDQSQQVQVVHMLRRSAKIFRYTMSVLK